MKIAAVVLIMMVGVSFNRCIGAYLRCEPCTDGNCDPPEDCRHGITDNPCGRKVCAKGPGQRCGGRFNHWGNCGDGMFCACSRCNGCSVATLECFSSPNSAKCV